MSSHLADVDIIDVLEGTAGGQTRRHVAECGACQTRLQGVGEGLKLAQSAAEPPEPSPLYWDHFRLQVGRGVEAKPAPRLRLLWGGLATAAAVLMLAVWMPLTPNGAETRVVQLPAWSSLPPADSDQGLAVLTAIAPMAAEELGVVADCRDVGNCLAELSDEESQALADALRDSKGGTS